MGSTPVYKSGLHDERLLEVKLNEKKCIDAVSVWKFAPGAVIILMSQIP